MKAFGITKESSPRFYNVFSLYRAILLLAPSGHKHASRTVQRHHTPWSIPKHNAPETDVPPVGHDQQGIPRTWWHCGSAALDTPWPLQHPISTHYHIN